MNKIWTCMFEWLNAHPAPRPPHQVTQRITVLVPNRIKSSHTRTKVCEQELSVFAGHNFSAMSPCAQRVHVHDSKGVLSTGVGWRGRSPVSEAIVLLFKGNFQMIIGDGGALVGIDSRSQVCWHLWCCSLYPSWAAAVLSADKVVQYTPSPTNEPHTQVQTAIFGLMPPLGLADSVKPWISRTSLLVTKTVLTIY